MFIIFHIYLFLDSYLDKAISEAYAKPFSTHLKI